MNGWVRFFPAFVSNLLLTCILASCARDGSDAPPIVTPPDREICEPKTAGIEGAAILPMPGVQIPTECKILDDDPSIAVHRRQVRVISTLAQFQTECRLDQPDPIADLIDFDTDELLLIRIPDISAPRWAVIKDDLVTIGEGTTECTGAEVHALRYLVRVPKTSTVTFFLCPPSGCDSGDEN